jgi:peptidyl-dipeptidase Dcp
MQKSSLLLLAVCLAAPLSAAEPAAPPAPVTPNPLLTESTLPYHLPLFDRIKDEHYGPAFTATMAMQLQEVEAIANNPAAPTFENTVVALDRSGLLLNRVSALFFNLTSANTNPALQQIETEMAPKLSAHNDAIFLNARLYARVKAVYDQRESLGLDAESKWLLERYHRDFVRGGANLSDADKQKLKALNADIATTQTLFSQNVQSEANADALLVDTRGELAGLTDSQIATAAAAAQAAGHPGKFSLALLNTSPAAATAAPMTTAPSSPTLRRSAPNRPSSSALPTTPPTSSTSRPPTTSRPSITS